MSRMSELSGCIADLKAAAAALFSAAETLTALYSGEEPAQGKPKSRPITKEEVRAELASRTAAGGAGDWKRGGRGWVITRSSPLHPAIAG